MSDEAQRKLETLILKNERENLDDIVKLFDTDSSTNEPTRWIFRGGTKLETSLERAIRDNENPEDVNPWFAEWMLLREFRRAAHHYLRHLPKQGDTLQWMALMQHYGAPTRLQDWTYSPHAALYFSLNRIQEKEIPIFWGIDADWLRKAANGLLNDDGLLPRANDEHDVFAQYGESTSWDTFNKYFRPEPKDKELLPKIVPFVYPVNPFFLNDRLLAQKGLFLCPSNISMSFVENLISTNPQAGHVKGVRIKRSARRALLDELQAMNIHQGTLFPGLGGFAESLHTKSLCYEALNSTYLQGCRDHWYL